MYSWIYWFASSTTSRSIFLGQFLYVWIISEWYLGELMNPPSLQEGVETNCWIYYRLFIQTHPHIFIIPLVIIYHFCAGHWWLFMIHPMRLITHPMNLSDCGNEFHWWLTPWLFISYFCSFYYIFLQCLFYHGVFNSAWIFSPNPTILLRASPQSSPRMS